MKTAIANDPGSKCREAIDAAVEDQQARADTCDDYMRLRAQIGALLDDGGGILAAPQVEWVAYTHLEQFDSRVGCTALMERE